MTTQSAFELRYQCLTLAQTTLVEEFNKNESKDRIYPTTDDIFKLAGRINDFISGKPGQNKKPAITTPVLIPFDDAMKIMIGPGKALQHQDDQIKMFSFLAGARHDFGATFGRASGVTSVTAAWSIAKCLSAFNHSIILVFENTQMANHAYGVMLKILVKSAIPIASRQPGKYLVFANGSDISFHNIKNIDSLEGRFCNEMICDATIDNKLFAKLETLVLDAKSPDNRIVTMRSV